MTEFDRKKFGARLKMMRLTRKYTQKKLGELVGLSSTTISSLERGLSSPRAEPLVLMGIALSKTVQWLTLGQEVVGNSDVQIFVNCELTDEQMDSVLSHTSSIISELTVEG